MLGPDNIDILKTLMSGDAATRRRITAESIVLMANIPES